jgi:hypothetical protein
MVKAFLSQTCGCDVAVVIEDGKSLTVLEDAAQLVCERRRRCYIKRVGFCATAFRGTPLGLAGADGFGVIAVVHNFSKG